MRSGNTPVNLTGALRAAGGGAPRFDFMAVLAQLPGFMTSQAIGCINYMNEMIEIAKLPPEEWSPKFAAARR